jgi:hypothetical protein
VIVVSGMSLDATTGDNTMTPQEALANAQALKQYLHELYEDDPGDDAIADRHLETAAKRADDLVRALERWNNRMKGGTR